MNTLWFLCALLPLLLVAAYRAKIYPSMRLVAVAVIPVVVWAFIVFLPAIFWALVVLDGVLLLLVLADLLTLPRSRAFSVQRESGHIASLQKPHRVTLTISNHGARDREVTLRDGAEEQLHPEPKEFTVVLKARSRSTLHYEIKASRRGRFTLFAIFLKVQSRAGLWCRTLTYREATHISVYPDMKQLAEYDLLARTNRLSLMGVRRTRKIGQDNEFERLRDYTLDDNYKHIDWRSTARRRKLTVRDFQANQSQRIIFLIDCGRMMTNESAGLSLLDHALNSMLMLSFVALRQGDQVGLLCFSDTIHGFVPPAGGSAHMNRLLHAAYDRFPQMVESRYDEAFLHLAAHCRKRALVVLITNLIDEVNAHQVQRYLENMVGRHLPLGVLLRDHRMFDAADLPFTSHIRTGDDRLYRAAAAAEILSWRHQVLCDLESKGVLVLDTFPEQMTAPLVNRYLDVKARHLL